MTFNFLVSFKVPKSCHITLILWSFHWFRITERFRYKIMLLTYEVLAITQPSYRHHLITVQLHRNTCSSVVTLSCPSSSLYNNWSLFLLCFALSLESTFSPTTSYQSLPQIVIFLPLALHLLQYSPLSSSITPSLQSQCLPFSQILHTVD